MMSAVSDDVKIELARGGQKITESEEQKPHHQDHHLLYYNE